MNFMSFCGERKQAVVCALLVAGVLLLVFLGLYTQSVIAPTTDLVATTSVETVPSTSTVPATTTEDFEGEADINVMALDMKEWKWISATLADGTVVTPVKVDAFSITFNASGAFSAETDCNSITGSYEARNGDLSLGSIAATKMFCENSQEATFSALLSDVVTYKFTSKGHLIMLTATGTEVVFR